MMSSQLHSSRFGILKSPHSHQRREELERLAQRLHDIGRTVVVPVLHLRLIELSVEDYPAGGGIVDRAEAPETLAAEAPSSRSLVLSPRGRLLIVLPIPFRVRCAYACARVSAHACLRLRSVTIESGVGRSR